MSGIQLLVLSGIGTFFFKVYHYSIAAVRKKSGSTSMGFIKILFTTAATMVIMAGMMMLMRGMLGGAANIRGEMIMYLFTGVSMYITHNTIFQAISSMKKSDPMLPVLSVSKPIATIGSIIEVVYMTLAVNVILYLLICFYYGYFIMHDPMGVAYCYILLVVWSVSFGLIFQALMPLSPTFFGMLAQVYRRIGIITSGKMIPGNLMPLAGRMGGIFIINPLFHLIDQLRGFIFAQYDPFISNLTFPAEMSIAFFFIAMVITFITNRIG